MIEAKEPSLNDRIDAWKAEQVGILEMHKSLISEKIGGVSLAAYSNKREELQEAASNIRFWITCAQCLIKEERFRD